MKTKLNIWVSGRQEHVDSRKEWRASSGQQCPEWSPSRWPPGLGTGFTIHLPGKQSYWTSLRRLLAPCLSRQGTLTDCPTRASPEGKMGFPKKIPASKQLSPLTKVTFAKQPSVTFAMFENVSFTPDLPPGLSFISSFFLFKLQNVIFVGTATLPPAKKKNQNRKKKSFVLLGLGEKYFVLPSVDSGSTEFG